MTSHITHSRDSSAISKLDYKNGHYFIFVHVFISKKNDLIFLCEEYFNIALPAKCLFPQFHRCFEWETLNPKELIPFICVVFSNVVLGCKKCFGSASTELWVKRCLLCQVEVCEIHATTNTHFLQLQAFSCFFFSAFLRVVCVSQIKT